MGLSSKQVSVDIHCWPQAVLEFPKPEEKREEKQNAPLLQCPRCESTNTKFCYYNNYSRSQPRHFCRACRRHWTEGGTLRNIPVGGGRKNKRRKINPAAASSTGNPTAPPFGEMEGSIFPDILGRVPLYPPPPPPLLEGLFDTSQQNASLTFVEDFSGGVVLSGGRINFTAAGSSCEDGLLGTASGLVKNDTVFPASYWDFWDGGAADFNDADVVQPVQLP